MRQDLLSSIGFAAMLCTAPLAPVAAQTEPAERWTPRYDFTEKQFGVFGSYDTLVDAWDATELSNNNTSTTRPTDLFYGTPRDHVASALRDEFGSLIQRGPYDSVVVQPGDDEFILTTPSLSISCYAVRIIAAVKTEDLVTSPTDPQYPDNIEHNRKPLRLELEVDDQPAGATTTYLQRVPYWDDFYCVTELYFNADAARAYTLKIRATADSQVDLYIHQIELHDVLAGLPGQVQGVSLKAGPTTFTLAERTQLRQLYTGQTGWEKARDELLADQDDKVSIDWTTPGQAPSDRQARDDLLWDALMPMNVQAFLDNDDGNVYGSMQAVDPTTDQLLTEAQVEAAYGEWKPNGFPSYIWYMPFELTNTDSSAVYTRDDLVQHRTLHDVDSTYPFADDGTGVYFADDPNVTGMSGPVHWAPIASALRKRWKSAWLTLAPYETYDLQYRLPWLYHAAGDTRAARDAALLLAKFAYIYPSIDDPMRLGPALKSADQYGRDQRLLFRSFLYPGTVRQQKLFESLALQYDRLYDFIDGNQELADAVNRYVPWVTTPGDVQRMIETRILQYGARRCMVFQFYNPHSPLLATAATVQQGPAATSATEPWMDFLWQRTYAYPFALTGLPDLLSTSLVRDGTTTIGSVFYAVGEQNPHARAAEMTRRYVDAGGDADFDLTDQTRFRKLLDGDLFALESTIAGGFPMTIGNVGAPDKPRVVSETDETFVKLEDRFRRAWHYLQDPRAAWLLVNYDAFGRESETDTQWNAILSAAQQQGRNPFLSQPSRVMPDWAAILEAGQDSDDYRFKRTAYLRVGYGQGHSHRDALDLQVQAHGVRMANDLGHRGGYNEPSSVHTMVHNRVEVGGRVDPDDAKWDAHSYVTAFKPFEGMQYVEAASVPPSTLPAVQSYRRQVALIDVDEGVPSSQPFTGDYFGGETLHDPAVTTPSSYIFDVQRMEGGTWHTYAFHGNYSDDFDVNYASGTYRLVGVGTGASPPDATDDGVYLRKFLDNASGSPVVKWAADAESSVVATWRLRRSTDPVYGYRPYDFQYTALQQRNAEEQMLGVDYDSAAPRRYTRLHLFGTQGRRLLVGHPSTDQSAAFQQTWPFLYVQNRAVDGQGDPVDVGAVYPAIIEPFVGAGAAGSASGSFITSIGYPGIAGNSGGADKAVALTVQTANGHDDVCFSDGLITSRTVSNVGTFEGRFAYVSSDSDGLRAAQLVEGEVIDMLDRELKIATDNAVHAYEADITWVDYPARQIRVDAELPAAAVVGEHLPIGNAEHTASFTVVAAQLDGQGGTILTLKRGLDLAQAEVKEVIPAGGGQPAEVRVNLRPLIHEWDGMMKGLAATNGGMTKSWTAEHIKNPVQGSGGETLYRFTLDGSAALTDFPLDDQNRRIFRLWHLGVGDTVRIPAHAYLRRTSKDTSHTIYALRANTPTQFGLTSEEVTFEWRTSPAQAWTMVPGIWDAGLRTFHFTQTMIDAGAGRIELRCGSIADLLSHWRLDETTGTAADDEGVANNDATATSGGSWTTGTLGGARQITSSGGYLTASPAMSNLDEFTVSLCFRTSMTSLSGCLYTETSSTDGVPMLELRVNRYSAGDIYMGMRSDSGSPEFVNAAYSAAANDGNWHHLAMTRDGDDFRLYFDGQLVRQVTVSVSQTTTDLATLGAWRGSSGAGHMLDGDLDDVRLYDRALTADEIAALSAIAGL